MTKDEIGLLLSCIEGDDTELEKYSENKLSKLGFPLEQIEIYRGGFEKSSRAFS